MSKIEPPEEVGTQVRTERIRLSGPMRAETEQRDVGSFQKPCLISACFCWSTLRPFKALNLALPVMEKMSIGPPLLKASSHESCGFSFC